MAAPKITAAARYVVTLKQDVPRGERTLRARDTHQLSGKVLKEILEHVATYEKLKA